MEGGDLVGDLGVVHEGAVAVRESGGNPERLPGAGIEADGDPAPAGGAPRAEVDGDVPDGAADDPHELPLRGGGFLVVQAPDGPGPLRPRAVVLDEGRVEAERGSVVAAPGLHEPAPVIDVTGQADALHVREGGREDLHRGGPYRGDRG